MRDSAVAAITIVALVFIAGLIIVLDSLDPKVESRVYYIPAVSGTEAAKPPKNFNGAFPVVFRN